MTPEQKNKEIFGSFPNSWHEGVLPEYDLRRRIRRMYWTGAVAAALLVPLAVAGLWKTSFTPSAGQAALASYRVDKGVKGRVVLPDSTVIVLNSGSTMDVLSDFGEGERRVFLDGEGWFEVTSDQQHPFWVETPSGITVKVTGTQFNLCSYKDEDFNVYLSKGSIELEGTTPGIPSRVKPSQQVSVRHGKVNSALADEKTRKNATAWKEGVLVFEDKPMREALPMLERWYGVRFNVMGVDLMKERLTGEFDTETIQDVMNVLSLTHHFYYNINGKEITIALRK